MIFGSSTRVRVFVYREPVDMRKAYDTLSALVEGPMKKSLLSGDVFAFLRIPLDSAAHSATTRPPVPEHPAAIGAQRRVPSPGSERSRGARGHLDDQPSPFKVTNHVGPSNLYRTL